MIDYSVLEEKPDKPHNSISSRFRAIGQPLSGFISLQHHTPLRSTFWAKVRLCSFWPSFKDTVSIILRVVDLPLVSDQWKIPSEVEALTQCDCCTGLLTRLVTTRISLLFHRRFLIFHSFLCFHHFLVTLILSLLQDGSSVAFVQPFIVSETRCLSSSFSVYLLYLEIDSRRSGPL